jgi:hypothetical protein
MVILGIKLGQYKLCLTLVFIVVNVLDIWTYHSNIWISHNCSTNLFQFVEHISWSSATQQSVIKFMIANAVIWSHFVVLPKSNFNVQKTASALGLLKNLELSCIFRFDQMNNINHYKFVKSLNKLFNKDSRGIYHKTYYGRNLRFL